MLMNEAYPSAFLKSADVKGMPGGEVTVEIESCESETIGQGDDTNALPVLRFVGKSAGLVVNKTNSNALVAAFGNNTDDWKGETIVVYSTQVQFKGELVDGLRVRIPKREQRPRVTEVVNVDDDVPF